MQSINTIPWVPGLPFSALDFREEDDAFGQPTVKRVNFSEKYIQSNGSNLNAGSTNDQNAIYTNANGAWSTVTNVFTTATSNPEGSISAGMFASIFLDAATTAVYIALITAVTTTTITLSSTVIYGTAPTTAANGITIKVGGAWVGPSGAVTFPFGLSGTIGALKNTNSDQVRLNVKNDQTYTMTAALPFATLGAAVMQGYTTNTGDLGKATFTSNITSAINFTSASAGDFVLLDLIFISTGASGSFDTFQTSATLASTFIRCVFHGGRGAGLVTNAGGSLTPTVLAECEAYDCNKSNTANKGAFQVNGPTLFYNCYAHDNTAGTNAHGFAGAAGPMILVNCIADTCGGSGIQVSSAAAGQVVSINSNCYNNSVDGVALASAAAKGWAILINNNFINNGGAAVNNTVTSQGGIMYNNGRVGNSRVDSLKSIVDTATDVFYPLNTTPFNAPNTGDFSTLASFARGTGRGAFTETDGTNSGTVSYPDIGAAQAQPFTQNWSGQDYVLPSAYLTHVYEIDFTFASSAAISLLSGSLPAGLSLSTVSPTQVQILGSPTALGTSNFTLRSTVGASTGDATFHITVLSAAAFNPLVSTIIQATA